MIAGKSRLNFMIMIKSLKFLKKTQPLNTFQWSIGTGRYVPAII